MRKPTYSHQARDAMSPTEKPDSLNRLANQPLVTIARVESASLGKGNRTEIEERL